MINCHHVNFIIQKVDYGCRTGDHDHWSRGRSKVYGNDGIENQLRGGHFVVYPIPPTLTTTPIVSLREAAPGHGLPLQLWHLTERRIVCPGKH